MNGIDKNYRIRPAEQPGGRGRLFTHEGWGLLLLVLAVLFAAEGQYAAQTGPDKGEVLVSAYGEQGEAGPSWVISLDGVAIGEVRGLEFTLSPAETAQGGGQSLWVELPGRVLRQGEAEGEGQIRLRVTFSRVLLADGSAHPPEPMPRGLLDRLCSWVRRVFVRER